MTPIVTCKRCGEGAVSPEPLGWCKCVKHGVVEWLCLACSAGKPSGWTPKLPTKSKHNWRVDTKWRGVCEGYSTKRFDNHDRGKLYKGSDLVW